MNSADRHSLQFTMNKVVYKIFGAMSKDLYIEISAHFGIESVENLIADRRNRFINRYGETDIYVKCCDDLFISLTVLFYLLRLFNFCLLIFLCMLCYHIRWWYKVVYINAGPYILCQCITLRHVITRSSVIAEEPRDALCQLKSCQLPRNSAETTCTKVLNKSKLWSWRVNAGRCIINMCTQPWRDRVAFIVL